MSNIEEIRKAGQLYEDYIDLAEQQRKLQEALELNEELMDKNRKLFFSSIACIKGSQPTNVFWNTYTEEAFAEALAKFDRRLYSTEYKFGLPAFEHEISKQIAHAKYICSIVDGEESKRKLATLEKRLQMFLDYFNLSRENIDKMIEIELKEYKDSEHWLD